MTKLYDTVLNLLVENSEYRDSDKKLIWKIWEIECGQSLDSITRLAFLSCTTGDTITRCRRKIQELNPDLRGNSFVTEARQDIEEQKGTHIFREKLKKSSVICEKCGGDARIEISSRSGTKPGSMIVVKNIICNNCSYMTHE